MHFIIYFKSCKEIQFVFKFSFIDMYFSFVQNQSKFSKYKQNYIL